MSTSESFGQWLKQRRKAMGFTQQEIAKRINYAVPTLRKIESDDYLLSRQAAEMLAAALEIAPADSEAFIRFACGDKHEMPAFIASVGVPPSSNLPHLLTPLIGREEEVRSLEQLLTSSEKRLVTLTGVSGTGKTRLAIAVAHALRNRMTEAVYLVELAALHDPTLVAATIARTLDLPDMSNQPILTTLKKYLLGKEVVLLLDNFEQVIDAAQIVTDLLMSAPTLKIIVTSRINLKVSGEQIFPVKPLKLPEIEQTTIAEWSLSPAVQLFIEKARNVDPEFDFAEQARSIAEICILLDGLPLAIELAAAKVNKLSPQEMLVHLRGSLGRLHLLTDGPRNVPARQQTMRNAIAWSYDLLEPYEQILFQRLGIFADGFTLESAEAICNAVTDPVGDLWAGISVLLDSSLLVKAKNTRGKPRYTMLKTIREYAFDRLSESHEAPRVQAEYAHYFLAFAEKSAPNLVGPDQVIWLDQVEVEHDNFRAVLDWSQQTKQFEIGLRLANALTSFWVIRGFYTEGRSHFTNLLQMIDTSVAMVDQRVYAAALNRAGGLIHSQGEYPLARTLSEQSLAIWQSLGDKRGVASAQNTLGNMLREEGAFEQAQAMLEQSLALLQEAEDPALLVSVLHHFGVLTQRQAEYDKSIAYFEQSLAISKKLYFDLMTGLSLIRLAMIKAKLAILHGRLNELEIIPKLLTESLNIQSKTENKLGIAYVLDCFAGLAAVQNQPKRALRLAGAASLLHEKLGAPLYNDDQAELMGYLQLAEQALKGRSAMFFDEGKTLTIKQAVAYALEYELGDEKALVNGITISDKNVA